MLQGERNTEKICKIENRTEWHSTILQTIFDVSSFFLHVCLFVRKDVIEMAIIIVKESSSASEGLSASFPSSFLILQ